MRLIDAETGWIDAKAGLIALGTRLIAKSRGRITGRTGFVAVEAGFIAMGAGEVNGGAGAVREVSDLVDPVLGEMKPLDFVVNISKLGASPYKTSGWELMANYDTGLMYDTPGLVYDALPPITQKKARMAKIKLNLGKLPDGDVVDLANTVKTKLTTNASTFTSPSVSMTLLGTNIATSDAAILASLAADQEAKAKTTAKNLAIDQLKADLTSLGAYVDGVAKGDITIIEKAGMAVRAVSAPIGDVNQPENLTASAGDMEGEADLHWDRVRGARSYEVQSCLDPNASSGWTSRPSVTRSSTTVTGLTSGTRTWFRVRALGAAGSGPWSDAASKIIP